MRKGRRTVLVFIMGAGLLWAGAVGAADKKLESCGNGVVDAGEQCDWTNLNGQTCASSFDIFGAAGGTAIAVDKQCAGITAGGSISIQLNPVVGGVKVNAIEIVQGGGSPAYFFGNTTTTIATSGLS